ncbi:OmpA family protein [Moheibacter sediminis]|uniref:OmpA-OmpF porin, OOP family n=1 Tax=Moheibacter sediminis TaxID=1434700 RepID=A0A1W1ZXF3_9FLAO|nr:OmpA family protein [Moheibacter sediminis]SMC53135.1 OmpA-OmpF porin, OOP family [Moheibacter sediminis]
MRKALFAALSLAAAISFAQESDVVLDEITEVLHEKPHQIFYNKWSLELNGGMSKPTDPFTDGYSSPQFSFFHVDIGTRYMFSPKFGLKMDVAYDRFKNDDESKKFETDFYKISLQGIINVGRALNFESWTNTFGLLAHMGVGYSIMSNDNFEGDASGIINDTDEMANFIAGLTGQVRLSDKFALTGDFTIINNYKQQNTFDGQTFLGNRRGFDGTMYNMSLGLTYYLGSAEKHADWYSENLNPDYESRFQKIEAMLMDSDGDGVADYLDQEPNSVPGAIVDTKGITIDSNNNGVPDAIERYIEANCNCNGVSDVMSNSQILEQLVNSGIINVYFDYNISQPYKSSIGGIDFVVEYMKAHPNAQIEVIGYADPVGGKDYNTKLSLKRADAVKKVITDKGISASRLTTKGLGIDNNTDYQLSRRVIFKIK